MSIWSGATVLITGGTGSFANAFVRMLLNTEAPASVRLLSRSELRRSEMQQQFTDGRLRWLTGDVADYERMLEAMDGVNIVVHAAASKRVEGSEQETAEAIRQTSAGPSTSFGPQSSAEWSVSWVSHRTRHAARCLPTAP